jgi:hypothetical protein
LGLSPSAVGLLSETNEHWKKRNKQTINGVNKKLLFGKNTFVKNILME